MKNIKVTLILGLVILAATISYAQDQNFDNYTHHGPVFPFEAAVGQVSEGEIAINPNRPYYDVIIMDIDRWELCMNLERARYHCNSYTGHLWYQMGAFIFEGTLTAVYNFQLDSYACTALDSGWDRGHIVYSMNFIEGTNDLYGSFVYYEFPRRTNGIDAWLVQGTIGPHTYGQAPDSERPINEPSQFIHPKREVEEDVVK